MHRTTEPLVILDIGSCEGEDTVRYSRRFPRARIYAFEPLPGNQALVLANFERHGVTNAELVPVALSDREGESDFHVSSGRPPDEFAGRDWNYGNKSSSLLAPAQAGPMHGWIEFKETIRVRTQTLDAFAALRGITRVDFVHMDVQGAERLVLAGAVRTLPRVGAVWMEVSDRALYEGQPVRPEIERLMRSSGFVLAHEVMNGVEGDQLYVNRRFARSWLYLALRRGAALVRRARFRAGRLRPRILRPTPQ